MKKRETGTTTCQIERAWAYQKELNLLVDQLQGAYSNVKSLSGPAINGHAAVANLDKMYSGLHRLRDMLEKDKIIFAP